MGEKEKISEALLKVALGYQVAEVTEEYAEVDGALKLTKRKKTKKEERTAVSYEYFSLKSPGGIACTGLFYSGNNIIQVFLQCKFKFFLLPNHLKKGGFCSILSALLFSTIFIQGEQDVCY